MWQKVNHIYTAMQWVYICRLSEVIIGDIAE